MLVRDGKIAAVGDLSDVKQAAGSRYEYVDLEGKTVVPGFIESHDHMVMWGSLLGYPDVSPMVTPSVKEALQKLKAVGEPDQDGWNVPPRATGSSAA